MFRLAGDPCARKGNKEDLVGQVALSCEGLK